MAAKTNKAKNLELLDRFKTDVLYKNPKGEYFTSENLAKLSLSSEEKKAKKGLTKIERSEIDKTTDAE
ncbi:hypothetical protein [Saccharicrinis fermentans]|uniref:Uncharacterized protein n=1 Tax=Saccharicrinis fermentans DSM 9555 = JCM 21142 TaxID=869213 RepID=W7YT26_9BACT|nr:hypothetical protein [Saccharicrinis fermentans]GAF05594.1 hypothetical protein JCM21142_104334 [Saccharicrinis fermentans DSM 9555 = JCM 21142]